MWKTRLLLSCKLYHPFIVFKFLFNAFFSHFLDGSFVSWKFKGRDEWAMKRINDASLWSQFHFLFSTLWLTLMQILCIINQKRKKWKIWQVQVKVLWVKKWASFIIKKSNLSYIYHINITQLPLLWYLPLENPLNALPPLLQFYSHMHMLGERLKSDVSSINMLLMRKVDKLRGFKSEQKVKSRFHLWREWMTQFITLNWWMFLWYFEYNSSSV